MTSGVWVPRRDQERVMEWLQPRQRAAVWAGVGAGKTVMALSWLAPKLADLEVGRVLIVAPKLVAQFGWPLQVQQWGHLQHMASEVRVLTFADLDMTRGVVSAKTTRVAIVSGTGGLEFRDKRATKSHLRSLRERIHVCSWDAFPWLAKAYGKNWPYDCVVFDEASFLRDQQSERGKAARHVVHRSGVVEHVLELTASPAANHEEAMFAQLDLVQRGLLGSTLTEFREMFCQPDSRNWQTGQVYSWRVAAAMRAEFDRRCASVAISVPSNLGVPLVEAPVWIDMPDQTRAAYQDLERDLVWRGVTCGSDAVLHGKLRQACSGFVYDDAEQVVPLDTAKVDRLVELVQEIDEPLVVAYEFKAEMDRLRAAFGDSVADIRESGARQRFEAGKLRLLALHPASAGHGVDGLQRVCRHIVWTTVPQDRELYDQTNGRVHRHGTAADTVFAHVLVARDTREQDVWDRVLPGKETVQELILAAARVG